jgi:hypothetical protein
VNHRQEEIQKRFIAHHSLLEQLQAPTCVGAVGKKKKKRLQHSSNSTPITIHSPLLPLPAPSPRGEREAPIPSFRSFLRPRTHFGHPPACSKPSSAALCSPLPAPPRLELGGRGAVEPRVVALCRRAWSGGRFAGRRGRFARPRVPPQPSRSIRAATEATHRLCARPVTAPKLLRLDLEVSRRPDAGRHHELEFPRRPPPVRALPSCCAAAQAGHEGHDHPLSRACDAAGRSIVRLPLGAGRRRRAGRSCEPHRRAGRLPGAPA